MTGGLKAERAARLANEQELRRADKLIGELADALEKVLAATTNDSDDDCINRDRERCDDKDCWSCRARAALAKARLP